MRCVKATFIGLLAGFFFILSPLNGAAQVSRIAGVAGALLDAEKQAHVERADQLRLLPQFRRVDRVVYTVYEEAGEGLHDGIWPSQRAKKLLSLLNTALGETVPLDEKRMETIALAFNGSATAMRNLMHALVHPDYDLDMLTGLLMGSVERVTDAELCLLRSLVDLETAVTPRGVSVSTKRLIHRLKGAIEDPESYAKTVLPTHPVYRALIDKLPRYQAIEALGGWERFTLKERLHLEGWLAPGTEITEALKAYQRAHLVKPSGLIDEATRAALDVSALERTEAIELAIRKWQKSPTRAHDTFVRVNVPEYILEFWRDGELMSVRRSVHGDLEGKTLLMDRMITALELNPTWYVPNGIMQRDLLQRAKKDPEFFEREGFHVFRDNRTGVLRARQLRGEKNWLGRVIFRWNRRGSDGIYIHDSPFVDRYELPQRALSHGCVNVEAAVDLARVFAISDGTKTQEEFDALVRSGKTHKIKLRNPIPAFLEYVTVTADLHGRLGFLPDVYGYDPWNQEDVALGPETDN